MSGGRFKPLDQALAEAEWQPGDPISLDMAQAMVNQAIAEENIHATYRPSGHRHWGRTDKGEE